MKKWLVSILFIIVIILVILGIYKIGKNKSLVVDAKYDTKNAPVEYYSNYTLKFHKLNDIRAPYINICSEEAKKINKEIEKDYNNAIDIYINHSKYTKEEQDPEYLDSFDYFVYNNKEILSVVTDLSVGKEVLNSNYKAYNFDLKNKKIISFDEALKRSSLTREDLEIEIKDNLTKKIEEFSYAVSTNDISEYVNSSLEYLRKSDSINFYFDNDNNLTIFIKTNLPLSFGELELPFKIVKK